MVEGVIPADKVGAVCAEVETVTAEKGVHRTYQGLHSARGMLDSVSSFLPYLTDERGDWHAHWPYNQEKPGRIPAPYPDFPIQLSSLWIGSDFTPENGGAG